MEYIIWKQPTDDGVQSTHIPRKSTIFPFRGSYAFLSNFYEAPVTFDGITYQNNEAAFQAQKTLDESVRRRFADLSPKNAKAYGHRIALRSDWEAVKYALMYMIVKSKFAQNPDLAAQLLATEDCYLLEQNTWHDTTWGVTGETGIYYGRNWLGEILMRVRDELRDGL